jgi:hypothetical protein
MKKTILALPLVLLTLIAGGQAPFPSKNEIKQFGASKTCVVLEDDPFSAFNVYMKKCMNEFWTVTPFEFIETDEFSVRMLKPEYSFIILTETNYDKDKSNSVFNFINLLLGKNVEKLGQMPEICAIPLSFAGEDDIEYGYKLGAILMFIQKHARLIMEDPSKTGRRYLKFYNENVPQLVNKTILVKQEDLAPEIGTIDRIKAIYSNKIEIVSEESIVKAIESRAASTVILHKVGPVGEMKKDEGYCFKMLIGTDDANMYYYNLHSIDKANPNGLLPADLARMARFD